MSSITPETCTDCNCANNLKKKIFGYLKILACISVTTLGLIDTFRHGELYKKKKNTLQIETTLISHSSYYGLNYNCKVMYDMAIAQQHVQ